MAHQDHGRHFAILIGIDDYSEKPLKGCVNDVLKIKKSLEGIKHAHVKTNLLTASRPTATTSSSTRSTGNTESRPTHGNVIATMYEVISQARAGDFVYIHFSGHGTAFRPPLEWSPSRAFSNLSTGDLALNLLEDNGPGVHYMRGFELASMVKRMTDKKLIVTLVLDCCFSGSVMRNDASVRYLEYDHEAALANPPAQELSLGSDDELRRPAYRNASLGPNWLVNPKSYTVVTACGPHEEAKEIHVGGQWYGALSYLLHDTFDALHGIGGKQHFVYQHLRARFASWRALHKLTQSPMWYGNKNLYFLGLDNPLIEPAPFPVIKLQDRELQLEAGRAHGICEGDRFEVREIGSRGLVHDESCIAEAVAIRALTSVLKVPEDANVSDAVLIARPRTHLSLKSFPVRLEIDSGESDGWEKALEEHQSLSAYHVGAEVGDRLHSFCVAELDDESYEIRDENNHLVQHIAASSIDPRERTALAFEAVEHLARFEFLKDLANDSAAETDELFRKSFNVRIVVSKDSGFQPGCKETRNQQEVCSHPGCILEVMDQDVLYLEVENLELPGGHAFCVHMFGLGVAWDVVNISSATYEVVPPRSSNKSDLYKSGSDGILRRKIQMKVPPELKAKGETQCVDIFKIFITTRPTSLLSFEMPQLGHLLERRKQRKMRGSGTFSTSEDWVAMSFRVRTCSKIA